MSLIWILVMSLFGGLGPAPSGSEPAPPDGTSLVASWSQSEHETLGPEVVGPTVVIETEADRDAFAARLPAEVPTGDLEAVDLSRHVVVAGGYPRCQEHSRVVETDRGYRLEVVDGDERVSCGWSPYTIDVWAVERS
ncbi:hypothetical protein ABFT23_10715 [Nocardioides sp. C4-1]|uniref:hypothetical protein n=1 Tax=Nocardioides sp. C4-1 TaxID=3151851 RepID=UPI00326722B4